MKFLSQTAIIYAVAIVVIFFCKNFYIWLTIIFFMGAGWVAYTVTRQALLNILSEAENRSIIIGLYSMIVSAGLTIGPLLVKIIGADNYLSFVIAASITLLSFAVLDKSKNIPEIKIKVRSGDFIAFVKENPSCFLARFLVDFGFFCFLNFSVVFGKKIGLNAENSGLLVTAFCSSFFADALIGVLLKKINPYKVIAVGFIGCFFSMIIIALFYKNYYLLMAVYFFLGICGAFVYIAAVTIVNRDYKKNELVAANSALQTVGSLGFLCSGFLGGLVLQFFGANGFIAMIALSCVIYLTFYVIYEKKNSARS